ncbi:hypothetical protein IRJ41_012576 [Triplophysa rosa]|uniref:Uncharacterized protein n=1 Tax=Triplophysa rosa TaxID=992332 RepID=A0A9W7T2T7_TRIRA|nr:hypothetical protein IRJ41_012576 [Triplophysa rosa]
MSQSSQTQRPTASSLSTLHHLYLKLKISGDARIKINSPEVPEVMRREIYEVKILFYQYRKAMRDVKDRLER